MSRKKGKLLVILGLCCLTLLLGAIWYSIGYNDSRLVIPTDFSTFRLQIGDIPMAFAMGLMVVYVLFLIGSILYAALRMRAVETTHTRIINPKLGFMGFCGLLGFFGFWTYSIDGRIFPFAFFAFFGFFGFFYEGRMSETLIDERFRENSAKAQLKALKFGLTALYLLILLVGMGLFSGNLAFSAIFLLAGGSTIIGITLFLCAYLLYRYDRADDVEE